MNLYELANSVEKVFQAHMKAKRWVVAYSGGIDSTVLLYLAKQAQQNLQSENKPVLVAIHVNHGLNESANEWVAHCQEKAQSLGVKLEQCRVDIQPFLKQGLESAARTARYQAFASFFQTGDVFFLGHHLDDQVETFFLRLKRAAGVRGLGAIKTTQVLTVNDTNITLVRPLLTLEKKDLLEVASNEQLTWIEDNSNKDENIERNFLRQAIIPNLASRWPTIKTSITKSIAYLQESQQLLNDLAENDFEYCKSNSVWERCVLNKSFFYELSFARRKNVLRYVLESYFNYYVSETSLLAVCQEGCSHFDFPQSNLSIELFSEQLFFYEVVSVNKKTCAVRLLRGDCINFLGAQLSFDSGYYPYLDIKVREGGERSHPQLRQHSQRLKKLFQEYAVPPWWREKTALFYFEDDLVAVGDLWIEKNAAADLKISCQR